MSTFGSVCARLGVCQPASPFSLWRQRRITSSINVCLLAIHSFHVANPFSRPRVDPSPLLPSNPSFSLTPPSPSRYFHVEKQRKHQIVIWHQYIDGTLQDPALTVGGSHDSSSSFAPPREAVVAIFERCLIPCALYAEFWERYSNYLEAQGDVDGARDVLLRGCKVRRGLWCGCLLVGVALVCVCV